MVVFTITILVFLFIQPSEAVEIERCKECHGAIKPLSPATITKDCLVCHDTHGGVIEPGTRDPERVHDVHEDAGKRVRQKSCQKCHRSPVECTKCHNSHENLESIIRSRPNPNLTNISLPLCTDCHGQLPQPKGHEDFRGSLSKSKHKWMNCDTCHNNKDYKMELNFKNLITVQFDDSIRICKICHSSQYGRLQEGDHGTPSQKCVDCHNPHTTQLSGPKFKITPKETPVNISTRLETTTRWLTNKIPILRNTVALSIIFIVVLVVIAEHLLSKEEEGKKTAYDMIKIRAGENTLKTLEIKLINKNIDIVSDLLEENGINILGMTMQKESKDDSFNALYKYVVFIDIGRIVDEKDEKNIIDKILSISNVKMATFTDKYEL